MVQGKAKFRGKGSHQYKQYTFRAPALKSRVPLPYHYFGLECLIIKYPLNTIKYPLNTIKDPPINPEFKIAGKQKFDFASEKIIYLTDIQVIKVI